MKHILIIAFSISLISLTPACNPQSQEGSQNEPSRNTNRSSQQPAGPSPAQTDAQTKSPTVELNDPAGDVEEGGADIIKTSFNSDGEKLAIRIELKDEVAATFANKQASNVLELYVDTDRSEATGGALIMTERKGFEYLATVGVCIIHESAEGKSTSCAGGPKGGKITGLFSGLTVEKYDKDGDYNGKVIAEPMGIGSPSILKLPHGKVEGRHIEAEIPYTIMGMRSGQEIRILAAESFERSHESRYSRDIILILK